MTTLSVQFSGVKDGGVTEKSAMDEVYSLKYGFAKQVYDYILSKARPSEPSQVL